MTTRSRIPIRVVPTADTTRLKSRRVESEALVSAVSDGNGEADPQARSSSTGTGLDAKPTVQQTTKKDRQDRIVHDNKEKHESGKASANKTLAKKGIVSWSINKHPATSAGGVKAVGAAVKKSGVSDKLARQRSRHQRDGKRDGAPALRHSSSTTKTTFISEQQLPQDFKFEPDEKALRSILTHRGVTPLLDRTATLNLPPAQRCQSKAGSLYLSRNSVYADCGPKFALRDGLLDRKLTLDRMHVKDADSNPMPVVTPFKESRHTGLYKIKERNSVYMKYVTEDDWRHQHLGGRKHSAAASLLLAGTPMRVKVSSPLFQASSVGYYSSKTALHTSRNNGVPSSTSTVQSLRMVPWAEVLRQQDMGSVNGMLENSLSQHDALKKALTYTDSDPVAADVGGSSAADTGNTDLFSGATLQQADDELATIEELERRLQQEIEQMERAKAVDLSTAIATVARLDSNDLVEVLNGGHHCQSGGRMQVTSGDVNGVGAVSLLNLLQRLSLGASPQLPILPVYTKDSSAHSQPAVNADLQVHVAVMDVDHDQHITVQQDPACRQSNGSYSLSSLEALRLQSQMIATVDKLGSIADGCTQWTCHPSQPPHLQSPSCYQTAIGAALYLPIKVSSCCTSSSAHVLKPSTYSGHPKAMTEAFVSGAGAQLCFNTATCNSPVRLLQDASHTPVFHQHSGTISVLATGMYSPDLPANDHTDCTSHSSDDLQSNHCTISETATILLSIVTVAETPVGTPLLVQQSIPVTRSIMHDSLDSSCFEHQHLQQKHQQPSTAVAGISAVTVRTDAGHPESFPLGVTLITPVGKLLRDSLSAPVASSDVTINFSLQEPQHFPGVTIDVLSPKDGMGNLFNVRLMNIVSTAAERFENALLDEECALYLCRSSPTSISLVLAGRHLMNPVATSLTEGDSVHFIPV